jgi:hypothetical protein
VEERQTTDSTIELLSSNFREQTEKNHDKFRSVHEIRTEHLTNETLERVAIAACSGHARYERSCEIQGSYGLDNILRDVRPCNLVDV